MAQEIAFAAPRTEEMTRVVVVGIGAGVTGAVQGVVVKMAPAMGTLEPLFTWGTLLGIPFGGAVLALFTRGILSDLMMGIAAGGAGVVGFQLPELLAPITGGKAIGGGQGLSARPGVKQLTAGPLGAPRRMQQAASQLAQLPANASLIPIVLDEGILV